MRASLNSLSSALQPVKLTRPARFLQTSCRRRRKKNRLNAGAARWTPPRRWALAQHRTSFSQPGHIRQRAVVPRWPEEPLAQLSWASSQWHRRRSRRTSATRHVVARLSVETHVHRAAARRLPSRRAASQRCVDAGAARLTFRLPRGDAPGGDAPLDGRDARRDGPRARADGGRGRARRRRG